MKLKDNFHIYAMITILFGSLAYVLTRILSTHFSVFSLGFLRYFFASLALIIIAVCIKLEPVKKQDYSCFLLTGIVGFFLYILLFNKGQSMVTAATGSAIMATAPVITAFLAGIIFSEKLTMTKWLAIFVQFIGVGVLSISNGDFSFNNGVLWLILTAICLSLYNLIQRKLTKKYNALQISTNSIFVATVLLSVFSPMAIKEITTAPTLNIVYLIILGVCSGAIGCTAWAKAFSLAPKTSYVTNYMFITPFLTTLLGFLLIGETPNFATVIGGIIIILGMIIFNFENIFKNN